VNGDVLRLELVEFIGFAVKDLRWKKNYGKKQKTKNSLP
jgi:hypothetical protein